METAKRSTDRRIARTKAALHEALMSLILRRRYEAISIKEICDTADVSRSTFYSHYSGKDDLKRDGLEGLRMRLLDAAGRHGADKFAFSLAMFEHARGHIHHYRALAANRGGAIALGKIRHILAEVVRKQLAGEVDDFADVPPEIVVQYLVGAYMSMLTWWLDDGAKVPPQTMDAIFRRLVTQGAGPAS